MIHRVLRNNRQTGETGWRTGLLAGKYQGARSFWVKSALLIVIILLPAPLWGAEIGTKPAQQGTPPTAYERTQPKQYEKSLDLRLTPKTEEEGSARRVKKSDHGLTSQASSSKSKKKTKSPGKDETSSELGIRRQPEPPAFPSKGTDWMK